MYEQNIIFRKNHCWTVMRTSRQLFVGHVVGAGQMKRKEKSIK